MVGQLRTRPADRIVPAVFSLALVMCLGTTRVVGQTLDDWLTVSPDGRTVAWIESTDVRTADVWRASWDRRGEAGSPQQVTRSMGQIDAADLSEAEEHFYRGPDGLSIPTLVYKPKAFDPSVSYPVIVRLHGHPGQWNHSFEMMRQYFVQNGFVVVAPNPRGSRGFGAGFHDLHIADYGGLEFGDVMGVIPFMASLG